MRILVTGGTGLIGARLVTDRLSRGDDLLVVSRRAALAAERLGTHDRLEIVEADPATRGAWQRRADGCDAVVNLAGAGVADRRWTARYRRVLVDSRVESTRRVVEAIADAATRPGVLLSASAVGWYGECGDRTVDESAPAGDDFLARLAVDWEQAAEAAAGLNVRVVRLRLGVVLDAAGGALAKMLPIFRRGLGGPIGTGRQYMPWIHWRDVVGLIDFALTRSAVEGPLNVVAPQAVTNRRFTRALGRALHRPAFLPVPAAALRAAMGPFGRYAAISQRVAAVKAESLGYAFEHPELDAALADLVA